MPYRAISRRVQDLGPTLIIGLLVLAAGGWAFGALAEEVTEGDTGLDNRVADELHEHATRPLTEFFEAVTTLGNGIVLAGVAAIAAYLLARRRYYTEAVLMVLVVRRRRESSATRSSSRSAATGPSSPTRWPLSRPTPSRAATQPFRSRSTAPSASSSSAG